MHDTESVLLFAGEPEPGVGGRTGTTQEDLRRHEGNWKVSTHRLVDRESGTVRGSEQ